MNYQKEKLEKNKFTIAITTTKKVFRNNLTKEVKDLYSEHYRTLKKELRKIQLIEAYTVFMDWKN